MLTCPFCGWNEIERPMIDVDGEFGPIEGLAECEVCGAEEIDPAERNDEPNKQGWREAEKVKMYDVEKHGPLREALFPMKQGDAYQAYTESGRLVQLPEDHEMVERWKHNQEAIDSLKDRVFE